MLISEVQAPELVKYLLCHKGKGIFKLLHFNFIIFFFFSLLPIIFCMSLRTGSGPCRAIQMY